MRKTNRSPIPRVFAFVAALLVCKVTATVVFGYRHYFPPNFQADFLLGREAYFFGAYRWAFYTHLVSGPLSLLMATLLISEQFRRRLPAWHRRLGRFQVACVLLLLTPSGLWMSWYAATGTAAAAGLAALAVLTAVCITLGWRAAVRKQFATHERWMWRTYVLLCSAVVIRLLGGLATVLNFNEPWFYPLSVWTSWLMPLLVLETLQLYYTRRRFVPRVATSD